MGNKGSIRPTKLSICNLDGSQVGGDCLALELANHGVLVLVIEKAIDNSRIHGAQIGLKDSLGTVENPRELEPSKQPFLLGSVRLWVGRDVILVDQLLQIHSVERDRELLLVDAIVGFISELGSEEENAKA